MSEETNNKLSYADLYCNKLKAFDARALENAIAKAISDLVGVELKCEINNLDYGDRSYEHKAKFCVSLFQTVQRGLK